MEFLSFILSVALGFYLLGIIGRWLLRSWIRRKQREFAEQFGGRGGYTYDPNGNRDTGREGEVRVQKNGGSAKKVSRDVGEYVEYEEYEAEYKEEKKD